MTVQVVLHLRSCEDRCTKRLEYLLPKMVEAGACNAPHGGSCCVCGGRLPDVHIHLNASCLGCRDLAIFAFGGNVCSEGCAIQFVKWIEDCPPFLVICPGHGVSPTQVFGSWGRHQQHTVEMVHHQQHFVKQA